MATTTKSRKKAVRTTKSTAAIKKTTTKKAVSARAKTTKAKTVVARKNKARGPRPILQTLNIWNWLLALLLAAQAVALYVIAKDSARPVTTNFLGSETITADAATPALVPATRHLFDLNMVYLVSAFLILSAILHLAAATLLRKRYEAELQDNKNTAHWYGSCVVVSLMIVTVAMLSGISDLSTILLLVGSTAAMCLLMEKRKADGETNNTRLTERLNLLTGLLPWLVVGLYLWGTYRYSEANTPTYIYALCASIFILFSLQLFTTRLYAQGKGRWANYIYTHKASLILSFLTQSALAWQVFAGTLR